MKSRSKVCLFTLTGVVLLGAMGCSRRTERTSAETPSQTPSAQTQAPPVPNPSATQSPGPQKPETPPPVSTALAFASLQIGTQGQQAQRDPLNKPGIARQARKLRAPL